MLTRVINYQRILSDDHLKTVLESSYNFFRLRAGFTGYRYDQDKWENLDEYRDFLNKLQYFKGLYIDAFDNLCALCLDDIHSNNCDLVFSHPIGKNKEYPELIMEHKNLMPLCKECSAKYNLSYKHKLPLDIKSIYDLNKRIPSVVIPHLESTIQHMSYQDKQYIYGSSRLNRSMAMFAPKMFNYVSTMEIYSDHLESARFEAYKTLHNIYIGSDVLDDDYDYADFLLRKNAAYKNILIKNDSKLIDKYQYRTFSPLAFTFKNLRELRTGELDFLGKNYLCIIGENGVGKSTLMQSVYCAICSDRNNILYKDNYSFRRNVDLKFSFKYQLEGALCEKFFAKNSDYYSDNDQVINGVNISKSSIVRYQEIDGKKERYKKDIKIISLDDGRNNYGKHESQLKWLFVQSNTVFSKVAIIIKSFLNLEDSTLYRNKDRIFAEFDGEKKDLSKLSSGYKAIISIIISVFRQLDEISGGKYEKFSTEKYRLLALIDEVELHLHPKWKTTIVKKLTENFPEVFFIITTHDPLVLQQCDDEYCIKIEKDEKGCSEITSVIDFSDYDVDMLLSSPLFEADYESSPHERLKGEGLRAFFARKIVNESIQKYKRLSLEELALKLELAVRNEKN